MTFLKITDPSLKKTLVMVQILHVLVSVMQLCGTKFQCFYSTPTVVTIIDLTILMGKRDFRNLDQWNLLVTFWNISINVSEENNHQILDSSERRRNSFNNITYSESHSVNKEKKKKCYSGNMILLGKNMSSVTMEMLHSSEEWNVRIM